MKKLYLNSKVDNSKIRKETLNGREHYVVPSFTLPFDVVMNDIMYPKEQIINSYKGLENTLAPIGHPKNDKGEYVSALLPESINKYHAGAWNKNVELVGNRVYVEKWVDIEKAKQHELGSMLIDHIESGRPISTSVAVNLQKIPAKGKGYGFVANIAQDNPFDHDAILFNEDPAASIEQGVGMSVNEMVVNVSDAIDLNTEMIDNVNTNDDALIKTMYNKMKSLFKNDKTLNVNEENEIMEFTDKQVEQIGAIVANALQAKADADKATEEKLKEEMATNAKIEALEKEKAELEAKLKANEVDADITMREEVKRITGMSDEQVAKLDREMMEKIIGTRRDIDDEFATNSAAGGNGKELTADELMKLTYGDK